MQGIQIDFIVSQENLSPTRSSSTSMNKPRGWTALKFLRTRILNYCYDNCASGAAKWNCPAACVNLINTFVCLIYFIFYSGNAFRERKGQSESQVMLLWTL